MVSRLMKSSALVLDIKGDQFNNEESSTML